MSCDYDSLFYRVFCITLLGIAITFSAILTNVLTDINLLSGKTDVPKKENHQEESTLGRIIEPKNIEPDVISGITLNLYDEATTYSIPEEKMYEYSDEESNSYRNKRSPDSPMFQMHLKNPKMKKVLTNRLAKLLEQLDAEQLESDGPAKDKQNKENLDYSREIPDLQKMTEPNDKVEGSSNALREDEKDGDLLHVAMHNILLQGIVGHMDLMDVYKKVRTLVSEIEGRKRHTSDERQNTENLEAQFLKEMASCDRLHKEVHEAKKENSKKESNKQERKSGFQGEVMNRRSKNSKEPSMLIKTVIDITTLKEPGKNSTDESSGNIKGIINLIYNGHTVKLKSLNDEEGKSTMMPLRKDTENPVKSEIQLKANAKLETDIVRNPFVSDDHLRRAIADYLNNNREVSSSESDSVKSRQIINNRLKRSVEIHQDKEQHPHRSTTHLPKLKSVGNEEELYVNITTHFGDKSITRQMKQFFTRNLVKKIREVIKDDTYLIRKSDGLGKNKDVLKKKKKQIPIEKFDRVNLLNYKENESTEELTKHYTIDPGLIEGQTEANFKTHNHKGRSPLKFITKPKSEGIEKELHVDITTKFDNKGNAGRNKWKIISDVVKTIRKAINDSINLFQRDERGKTKDIYTKKEKYSHSKKNNEGGKVTTEPLNNYTKGPVISKIQPKADVITQDYKGQYSRKSGNESYGDEEEIYTEVKTDSNENSMTRQNIVKLIKKLNTKTLKGVNDELNLPNNTDASRKIEDLNVKRENQNSFNKLYHVKLMNNEKVKSTVEPLKNYIKDPAVIEVQPKASMKTQHYKGQSLHKFITNVTKLKIGGDEKEMHVHFKTHLEDRDNSAQSKWKIIKIPKGVRDYFNLFNNSDQPGKTKDIYYIMKENDSPMKRPHHIKWLNYEKNKGTALPIKNYTEGTAIGQLKAYVKTHHHKGQSVRKIMTNVTKLQSDGEEKEIHVHFETPDKDNTGQNKWKIITILKHDFNVLNKADQSGKTKYMNAKYSPSKRSHHGESFHHKKSKNTIEPMQIHTKDPTMPEVQPKVNVKKYHQKVLSPNKSTRMLSESDIKTYFDEKGNTGPKNPKIIRNFARKIGKGIRNDINLFNNSEGTGKTKELHYINQGNYSPLKKAHQVKPFNYEVNKSAVELTKIDTKGPAMPEDLMEENVKIHPQQRQTPRKFTSMVSESDSYGDEEDLYVEIETNSEVNTITGQNKGKVTNDLVEKVEKDINNYISLLLRKAGKKKHINTLERHERTLKNSPYTKFKRFNENDETVQNDKKDSSIPEIESRANGKFHNRFRRGNAEYFNTNSKVYRSISGSVKSRRKINNRLKRNIKVHRHNGRQPRKTTINKQKSKSEEDEEELYVEIETHFDDKGITGVKKRNLIKDIVKKIQKAIDSDTNSFKNSDEARKNRHMDIKKRSQSPLKSLHRAMLKTFSVNKLARRESSPISKSNEHTVRNKSNWKPFWEDQKLGSAWQKTYYGSHFLSSNNAIGSGEMGQEDHDHKRVLRNGVLQRLQEPLSTDADIEQSAPSFFDLGNQKLYIKDLDGTGFSIGFNQYEGEPPDPEAIGFLTDLKKLISTYQKTYSPQPIESNETGSTGLVGDSDAVENSQEIYQVKNTYASEHNIERRSVDLEDYHSNEYNTILNNDFLPYETYQDIYEDKDKTMPMSLNASPRNTNDNQTQYGHEQMGILQQNHNINENILEKKLSPSEIFGLAGLLDRKKRSGDSSRLIENTYTKQKIYNHITLVNTKNTKPKKIFIMQNTRSKRETYDKIRIIASDSDRPSNIEGRSDENIYVVSDDNIADREISPTGDNGFEDRPELNSMERHFDLLAPPLLPYDSRRVMRNYIPNILNPNIFSTHSRQNNLMAKYPHILMDEISHSKEEPQADSPSIKVDETINLPISNTLDNTTDDQSQITKNPYEVESLYDVLAPRTNYKLTFKIQPKNNTGLQSGFQEINTSINKSVSRNGLIYTSLVNISQISKIEKESNVTNTTVAKDLRDKEEKTYNILRAHKKITDQNMKQWEPETQSIDNIPTNAKDLRYKEEKTYNILRAHSKMLDQNMKQLETETQNVDNLPTNAKDIRDKEEKTYNVLRAHSKMLDQNMKQLETETQNVDNLPTNAKDIRDKEEKTYNVLRAHSKMLDQNMKQLETETQSVDNIPTNAKDIRDKEEKTYNILRAHSKMLDQNMKQLETETQSVDNIPRNAKAIRDEEKKTYNILRAHAKILDKNMKRMDTETQSVENIPPNARNNQRYKDTMDWMLSLIPEQVFQMKRDEAKRLISASLLKLQNKRLLDDMAVTPAPIDISTAPSTTITSSTMTSPPSTTELPPTMTKKTCTTTTAKPAPDPIKLKILNSIQLNENMTSKILTKIDKNTEILQAFLKKLVDRIEQPRTDERRSEKVVDTTPTELRDLRPLSLSAAPTLQINKTETQVLPFVYGYHQSYLSPQGVQAASPVANMVYHGHIHATSNMNKPLFLNGKYRYVPISQTQFKNASYFS